MLRFAKWAVIPAVVCLAATFGTASDAQAAGWGISVNSGYPAYSCGPGYGAYGYGAYGYSAYGYSPYGYYGPAPIRVYRPAYYPPSFYFSFGGGHGGHHGHHGHHDDHHGRHGHH